MGEANRKRSALRRRCPHVIGLAVVLLALASLPGCMVMKFSPDGRKLLLVDGLSGPGVIVNTDGSGSWTMPGISDINDGEWAPDGRYIFVDHGGIIGKVTHTIRTKHGDRTVTEKTTGGFDLFDVKSRTLRALPDRILPPGASRYHQQSDGSWASSDGLLPPVAWREDGCEIAAVSTDVMGRCTLRKYTIPDGELIESVPLPAVSRCAGLLWVPGTDTFVLSGDGVFLVEGNETSRVSTFDDPGDLALAPDHKGVVWVEGDPRWIKEQKSRPQSDVIGTPLRFACFNLKRFDISTHALTTRVCRVPSVSADPGFSATAYWQVLSPDKPWMAVEILFAKSRPLGRRGKWNAKDEPGYFAIYTALPDGSAAHLLRRTAVQLVAKGTPQVEYIVPFVWSADGKHIAVVSLSSRPLPMKRSRLAKRYSEAKTSVFLYNSDGSGKRLLWSRVTREPAP